MGSGWFASSGSRPPPDRNRKFNGPPASGAGGPAESGEPGSIGGRAANSVRPPRGRISIACSIPASNQTPEDMARVVPLDPPVLGPRTSEHGTLLLSPCELPDSGIGRFRLDSRRLGRRGGCRISVVLHRCLPVRVVPRIALDPSVTTSDAASGRMVSSGSAGPLFDFGSLRKRRIGWPGGSVVDPGTGPG